MLSQVTNSRHATDRSLLIIVVAARNGFDAGGGNIDRRADHGGADLDGLLDG